MPKDQLNVSHKAIIMHIIHMPAVPCHVLFILIYVLVMYTHQVYVCSHIADRGLPGSHL